jgi:hypothetical protein
VTGSANLTLGGPESALVLVVSGAMELARTVSGGVTTTSFTVKNVSLSWDGVTTFPFPSNTSVTIRSDGSLDASAGQHTFTVGQFEVTVPSVALAVSAVGASAQATLGQGSLKVTGITPSTITMPGFAVGATGGFSVTLPNLSSLGLNSYTVGGPFVFERVDGVFRVRLTSSATLGVPGLPSPIALDSFVLGSNGVVTASISATQIGPAALSIRRASIAFTRTPAAGAKLTVSNGLLYLPVGNPISLGTLTFETNGTVTKGLNKLLRLGSGLSVSTSSSDTNPNWLEFSATNGTLNLTQTTDRTFTLLGLTATLEDFTVASSGTFSGKVTGSFRALGYTLSDGTFTVSKPAGWVDAKLTISSSDPFTGSFGPFQGTVTGWVATNGRHQLTVNGSVTVPFPGAWLIGSVSLKLRNYGIVDARFSGKACVTVDPESNCISLGSLSINSSGDVTLANILGFTGSVNVLTWNTAGADTRAPTFAVVDDIVVKAATAPIVVNYPLPAASDDRDDNVDVACVKSSGSSFSSGTTTVNCTATDDAGNQSTRSFLITVKIDSATTSGGEFELGDAATVESGGFMALSTAEFTMYSEPIVLGSARVRRDGTVRLTFTVPSVDRGRHHVQIVGVAPDGTSLIAVVPIDVRATPAPTPLPPGTELPRTGGDTAAVLRSAWLLLVLGGLLVTMNRQRRRAHLDRHPR